MKYSFSDRGLDQGGDNFSGNRKSKQKNMKWHYCQNFGHYKSDCLILKTEQVSCSNIVSVIDRILVILILS